VVGYRRNQPGPQRIARGAAISIPFMSGSPRGHAIRNAGKRTWNRQDFGGSPPRVPRTMVESFLAARRHDPCLRHSGNLLAPRHWFKRVIR
jgi:hypothetical protein